MMGARVERRTTDFILPTEQLRPLRDQIVVKVLPLKLSDTIIANWQRGAVRGEVIAVGPGRYPNRYSTGTADGKSYRRVTESRQFVKTQVKPGDVVHLGGMENGSYIFPKIMIGNEEHVICQEADVCGIECG